MIIARWNHVFKVTSACAPDVAGAPTEFFKSSAHYRVRPEAIQDRLIGLIVGLGLHCAIIFGARESELARDQMLPGIEQHCRRSGVGQRCEEMRTAADF